MIKQGEVCMPGGGYLDGDSLRLTVEMRLQRDSGLWHNWDSKAQTGFVGLKNQGATCYMNSLLQTLFHLPAFRQAVYHMPTLETDTMDKSIPLALQSLFYKLQFGDFAVSTKPLTRSFGWDSAEAFQQHDVEELNRVLCENLEAKMKGTVVEGALSRLFEGETSTYLECTEVTYTSERREVFQDVHLEVRGCADVAASFAKLVEVESMDGDNKYDAEGLGLQPAKKGVRFLRFPPVLQLHLKRFEYDPVRDAPAKVHDRYAFPSELDLTSFLHSTGATSHARDSHQSGTAGGTLPASPLERPLYYLHSVLVHSGGVHGGHYFAYCRPSARPGSPWFKFDDERVTAETDQQAMEENFGDVEEAGQHPTFGGAFVPMWKGGSRVSSAYMLVYVRACDVDRIICPVGAGDIAEHVRERLQAEADERDRKAREKREAHLYTIIKVVTDEHVAAHVCSLAEGPFELVDANAAHAFKLRTPKSQPFAEFKRTVEATCGVPVAQQRYWTWAKRENGTHRPCQVLSQTLESGFVSSLVVDKTPHRGWGKRDAPSNEHVRLFLEVVHRQESTPLLPLKSRTVLLFFKLYDAATETIEYAGRAFVPDSSRVSDLRHALSTAASFCAVLVPQTDLSYFEEVKFEPETLVDPLDPGATLKVCELEHGDIVIIQRSPTVSEAAAQRFPLAPDFLSFVRNRLVIVFKPLSLPQSDGFALELVRGSSYQSVETALGAYLRLSDPSHLRLTLHSMQTDSPKQLPLRYRERDTLCELLTLHGLAPVKIVYYEILDIPLPQLEQLKSIVLDFAPIHGEPPRQLTLRLSKGSTVAAVLAAACARSVEEGGDSSALDPTGLHLLELYSSKIFRIIHQDESVDHVNSSYWHLRAEPCEEVAPGTRLVHCAHVQPDVPGGSWLSAFGDPFLIAVHEDETLGVLKARIAVRLRLPSNELDTWKWGVVTYSRMERVLVNTDVVCAAIGVGSNLFNVLLGMQHEDKHPKRHFTHSSNASLKIFG